MHSKSNKIALSSIAMDLKRVAMGYHRGSISMGERFLREALERRKDVDTSTVKPYVKKILDKLDLLSRQTDHSRLAEDALMYSTLFQNASLSQ